MGTVSTVGTIQPEFDNWQVPMLPDETPVNQIAPIGVMRWRGNIAVVAKAATDESELVISLELPSGSVNWVYRFTNISIGIASIGGSADAQVDDWEDHAAMTFALTGPPSQNFNAILDKAPLAAEILITSGFEAEMYVSRAGQGSDRIMLRLSSATRFRAVDVSATTTVQMGFESMVEAYVYTIEQSRRAAIYTPIPVLTL